MKKRILTTTIQLQNQLQKIKKPTFDDFKSFNEKFSIVHDFIIRVIIISLFMGLLLFFLREITTNKYVLTDINVAHSIQEEGKGGIKIHPEDLKQKAMRDVKMILSTNKEIKEKDAEAVITGSVSNNEMPLNIAGFDLNQLYIYFRNILGMQNREIQVYLMEGEQRYEKYKLLLNIGNNTRKEKGFDKKADEKSVSEYIAKQILMYNSPYRLGLHLLNKDTINSINPKKVKEVEGIIYDLGVLAENEYWWEKVFQYNLWNAKKASLQLLLFCRKNKISTNHLAHTNVPQYVEYKKLLNDIEKIRRQNFIKNPVRTPQSLIDNEKIKDSIKFFFQKYKPDCNRW